VFWDQFLRLVVGGVDALRDAAGAHLATGGIVVIFPEGTRTTDGTVGRFRSGAARLAAETGVDLVPIGVTGTGELFGKGRKLPNLSSTGRVPVAVRIGDAVRPPDGGDPATVSAEVRDVVLALTVDEPPPVRPSATWEWARARLGGWHGAAFTFGRAFAEGLSFPVVAEACLLPVALAAHHARHARRRPPRRRGVHRDRGRASAPAGRRGP